MTKEIMAAMLSCSGLQLSEDEKKLFAGANPLGVTLFGRNYADKKQLKSLVAEIKDIIGRDDVLIAIDQEGGRVRRLAEPDFRYYMSQRSIGSLGAESMPAAHFHAQLIADDLQELGINWNYAPVLDLVFPETAAVLSNRCFGSDERQAGGLGRIMIETYNDSGICCCMKHMPGHGRITVDPHLNLPQLDLSLEELQKDFYPFKANAGSAPAAMTAHVVIKEVDDVLPMTQSKKAIKQIIRDEIGFEGFLISDSIDMRALKGSLGERTIKSLDAGCDAVCYCGGEIDGLREVSENCRVLDDRGNERLQKIREIIKQPYKRPDINEIAAKYKEFCGNAEVYNVDYDVTEMLNKLSQKD